MVRMLVGMLCSFPLAIRIILLLILPAVGFLTNQLIFWPFIFAPIYFSNSPLNKNDVGEKEFKRSFRNAYFVYHAVFIVIYGLVLMSACSVNELVDSTGL